MAENYKLLVLLFFNSANKERVGWDRMSQNVNRSMPCTWQKAVFKLLHKTQQRETGTHDYLYELEYSEEDLKHIEDEAAATERQAQPVSKDEGPLLT